MLKKYTIINEVDDKRLDLFNYYWDSYKDQLPALPSKLHRGMDQKAAILNIWLFYSDFQSYKTLKADRTFSHSFVYRLHQKTSSCLLGNSLLLQYPKAYEYQFLYAYYFGIEILTFLEETFNDEPHLQTLLKGHEYYLLTDDVIAPDDDIHKILKHFYIKTFDPTLSCHTYMKMHSRVADLLATQYDLSLLINHEKCIQTVS